MSRRTLTVLWLIACLAAPMACQTTTTTDEIFPISSVTGSERHNYIKLTKANQRSGLLHTQALASSYDQAPTTLSAATERAFEAIRTDAVRLWLGIDNVEQELAPISLRSSTNSVRFEQVHDGVPVYGSEVIVGLNKTGNVDRIVSHFDNKMNEDATAAIDENRAKQEALRGFADLKEMGDERFTNLPTDLEVLPTNTTRLVFVPGSTVNEKSRYVLAYVTDADLMDGNKLVDRVRFWIDAVSGRILNAYPILTKDAVRNTWNMNNGTDFGLAELIYQDSVLQGGATTDTIIDTTNNNMQEAHDYFVPYGFTGFDTASMNEETYVHYDAGYGNAYWNGSRFVFGDGDGSTFLSVGMGTSAEVAAHEYTHAVTGFTAALEYHDMPGAANEAFSDLFGKLVQYEMDGDFADWDLGEDIVGPSFPFPALRSMEDPTFGTPYVAGGDNQPDHMDEFWYTFLDNGGVHTNCGIISKAAYLMAVGGTHNGITVQPLSASPAQSMDDLGDLHYAVLTTYLTPLSDFYDMKAGLLEMCDTISGDIAASVADCQETVEFAYHAVGIAGVHLTSPDEHDYIPITAGSVNVRGCVPSNEIGEPLLNWNLEYDAPSGTTFPIVGGITEVPYGNVIAPWPLATVPDGDITLRLTAVFTGHTTTEEIVIHHDALQMNGFPVDIDTGASNFTLKSPMIVDVDNDGVNDIVYGATVFNGDGTVRTGWTNAPGDGRTNPAVIDIDGDGTLEVFAAVDQRYNWVDGSQPNGGGPVVHGYDADKNELWTTPYNLTNPWHYSNEGVVSALSAADVDGDLEIEVVFTFHPFAANTNDESFLIVLDAATGNEELNMLLHEPAMSSVALADLDDDDAADIVVITRTQVHVFDGLGAYLPGWPRTETAQYELGELDDPAIGDIDQDGDLEILAGRRVFHHNGAAYGGWPLSSVGYSSGAIAPLPDSEEELEIIVGADSGEGGNSILGSQLYTVHDADGSLVNTGWDSTENALTIYMWSNYNLTKGSPIIADLDGDCKPEVTAPPVLRYTDGSPHYVYSANALNGAVPAGFPRFVHDPTFKVRSTVAVGDLNDDGRTDVAMAAGGQLFVWELGSAYTESANHWPMFQHDPAHTGYFNGWAVHGEIWGLLDHQAPLGGLHQHTGGAVMSMIIDSLNGSNPAPDQSTFPNTPSATTVEAILESHPEIATTTGWFKAAENNPWQVLYQIAYWQEQNGIAAAMPFYGNYRHWVAVEGAAAAAAPSCADISYYSLDGLWIDDPFVGKYYATAEDLMLTYYDPTDGTLFEAVIEPPETEGEVQARVAVSHSFPKGSKCQNSVIDPLVQDYAIDGIREFHLTDDPDFFWAYEGTMVDDPIFVDRTDGNDYFLVPFFVLESASKLKTSIKRVKVVARVDASSGKFLGARYATEDPGYVKVPTNTCDLQWYKEFTDSPFDPAPAPLAMIPIKTTK